MYRLFIGIFLLGLFASPAIAQNSSDEFMLRHLLNRYTETYGGLRDANRLASVSIEGVKIQQGVEYLFHLHKKRPASFRYQLQKGNTILTSIFDGQRGWLETKQGSEVSVEEIVGPSLKILKKEAQFESPLYRYLENPENTILLEGREPIGGDFAYVLRVEEPESATCLYYLHPNKSHILRIDVLNGEGETVFQTLYREYKNVGGYPFAHEVENRIKGDTISMTRLNSVIVNPGLLSFYFQNPDS